MNYSTKFLLKKIKGLEIYFKGLENKEFYLSTNNEEDWMLYDYDSYDKSFVYKYDDLKKFISWLEEETNKIAKDIVGRGVRKISLLDFFLFIMS